MVTKILDCLDTLKIFPHRNIVETDDDNDAQHPLRSIVVWPYVILFRVIDEDQVVRVLHVQHGAQRE